MSNSHLDISNISHQEYKSVVYESILDLHRMDGIGWEELTKYSFYKGPNSLRNIVQDSAHDLEFSRGLRLMMMVSVFHKNKRLHKHSIDTDDEMIVKRPHLERAKGDMTKETLQAMQALTDAMKACHINDAKSMSASYNHLLIYLCRLREEIESSRSILARKEEVE